MLRMVCVKEISCLEELETMPMMELEYEHWGTKKHIRCYANMGIYQKQEWVVRMKTVEKDPLRTYIQDDDPVYLDSAVEFFLNMEPEKSEPRYLNFEMNANGALLAQFGKKNQRTRLKQLTERQVTCKVKLEEEEWSVLLRIPLEMVEEVYGKKITGELIPFSFNWYKISETKEQEHYISFTQIDNDYPDFHLPKFFEKGLLQIGNEKDMLRDM